MNNEKEEKRFLKTVTFVGFDKKDVLFYVDELNGRIYELETALDAEKKKTAALEKELSDKKAEISKLKG